MFRRAGIAFGVMALSVAGLVESAGAASPRTETTVHDFATFDVIDRASATLTRTSEGLSARFKTSLPAGHAETMWWVIFNDPNACTGGAAGCSDDDIFAVFDGGSNPAEISILNADGRVVPASGGVTFSAQLSVGSDGPGENLIPGGITDPLGALVLLVIDEHGAAASDHATRWLQTHALTWEGACPNQTAEDPFGDCYDTQIAVFPAS